jgi:hypothetical protein
MSPSVLIMRVTSKVGSRAVGGNARDARLLPGVAATQRHATAAAQDGGSTVGINACQRSDL